MSWPGHAVCVRVSATSANLGPGFDAVGLALARYDEVTAEVTGSGLKIEVSGQGAETAAAGEQHLVVRAIRAAFAAAGKQPPGLALRCRNAIPQGRGLGSSAAAIVAGLLAARALAGAAPPGDPLGLLGQAAALEGHPDNVAACLAGGLTIAWDGGSGHRAVRLEPHPAIVPVACVPAAALDTAIARRALPAQLPHATAATAAGRSALLVAALTQAPGLLLDATDDVLHQPFRAPLMPATAEAITRLRAAGIAAVLSGAGPSVLALTVSGGPGAAEVGSILRQAGTHWHISRLDVDRQGAIVQSVPPGAPDQAAHGRAGAQTSRARRGQAGPAGPGRTAGLLPRKTDSSEGMP